MMDLAKSLDYPERFRFLRTEMQSRDRVGFALLFALDLPSPLGLMAEDGGLFEFRGVVGGTGSSLRLVG